MQVNSIIVKSYEEELGSELWAVSSLTKSKEEILKCCEIAALYAGWIDEEEEHPDENFDYMVEYRENSNGEDTFNHYLEKFCDCTVTAVCYDFEYEW